MTKYRIETENRKWLNVFTEEARAIDFVKANLTAPLIFGGIPKDQWNILAKRCILTNLDTGDEFIVFYDGSKMLLTKYKSL